MVLSELTKLGKFGLTKLENEEKEMKNERRIDMMLNVYQP